MAIYLQGAGGAPGIALGHAVCLAPVETYAASSQPDQDPLAALARFAAAQASAAAQLLELSRQLRDEGRTAEAAIFDAHALLAQDVFLEEEVGRRVGEAGEALEPAIIATIGQMRDTIQTLTDPYLRERAADMDSVGQAILAALRGEPSALPDLPPGAIIVAADLTPAVTASLRGGAVAGFVTAGGGPTSHTAILARALDIPAVVGVGTAALAIPDGASLILDGAAELVIVEPDAATRADYERHSANRRAAAQDRQSLRDQPGRLADGHPIALWANIGHPDEARHARELGAEGIGLFRSEFLFLDRDAAPSEEEQFAAYRATLDAMAGRTVVVRTLDIGGDKPLSYLDTPPEANPFLGMRGLRLCMHHPDLFATQLRALLRAAAHGDLWIMLPMIATPEDYAWGRASLRAAAAALAAAGVAHRADVRLGAMIETPAAAITADLLAREAAFFSVGSNDLTQYTMAVDRGDAELASRYTSDAPAVLRLIARAAQAATQAGIPIGVCGELASLPDAAPVLAGLGITELSMNPSAIPLVKERLRAVTLSEAQAAARRAMKVSV